MLSAFQAEIPDPLAQDLPAFLPTGGVRAPAIGVLLLIFVCEHRLNGTSMQIEIKHISGSKGPLRHGREELLVDGPVAHHANGRWGGTGRMGGENHAYNGSCRRERNIQAIEQSTTGA
jgi:hypothetical protein